MKTLSFFSLLFLVSFYGMSQRKLTFKGRAIDDYITLKALIDSSNLSPDMISLNKFYDSTAIKAFIKTEKEKIAASGITQDSGNEKIAPQTASIFPATAVADALAMKIANQVKEELNIAYLNNFTDYINNNEFEEIKLLFPESRNYLKNIKTNLYMYKSFFPSIKSNFKTDINNISFNSFVEIFEDENTFKSALWNKTNIEPNKKYLAFSFDLLASLINNKKPTEYLDIVRERKYFKALPEGDTLTEIAHLITDLGHHLNSTNASIDVTNLFTNETTNRALDCFRVLLIKSNATNSKKWDNTKIDKLLPLFYNLVNSFATAPTTKDKLYSNYINLGKVLQESAKLVKISSEKTKYFSTIIIIAQAINQKDNTQLINGILNLTLQLMDKDSTIKHNKLRNILTFISNIASAKEGEEMLSILNAAALPVESYRIKRNNLFNISVNAYGGLFAGSENFSSINKTRENFVWGATAPVGLYVGWGTAQEKVTNNDGGGFGFFISLIDVGSVFAVRLQDNVSPLPELTWKNILAPGIHAVWSIKKTPISLMLGYQKGPELRSLKEEVTNQATGAKELKTVIDPTAGRFAFSAVVDIPLFNVYTKANKNK